MSMLENVLTMAKMWTPDVRIVQPQPARSTDELTAIFVKASHSNSGTLRGSGAFGSNDASQGNA